VTSQSPSIPPVRLNFPVALRHVMFASPGVRATRPVPARCPCRRERFRPQSKVTLSLLRTQIFELGASYQLAPWQTPTPTSRGGSCFHQSPIASTCLSCLVLPSSFVIGSATMSSVAQCSSITLSVVMASRTKW